MSGCRSISLLAALVLRYFTMRPTRQKQNWSAATTLDIVKTDALEGDGSVFKLLPKRWRVEWMHGVSFGCRYDCMVQSVAPLLSGDRWTCTLPLFALNLPDPILSGGVRTQLDHRPGGPNLDSDEGICLSRLHEFRSGPGVVQSCRRQNPHQNVRVLALWTK